MAESQATASLWDLDINPTSFFHERVVQAQERQKLKLPENVEFYLVNLLCEFVRVHPDAHDECLALMLKKALESPYGERVLLFKRMGDTALYFSGFFQEYFNRKSFDVGYYITMGAQAFSELSVLMRRKGSRESGMAKMYREISSGFPQAVDVLLDVSEHTAHAPVTRSTLSIYDAWLSTASQKLETELHERGILPVKVNRRSLN